MSTASLAIRGEFFHDSEFRVLLIMNCIFRPYLLFLPKNRFRGFINKYKLEYLYASREEKPAVADKVLELVKPGRFIVAMSKDTYAETEEFRAREKASQALREGAAKLRKDGYSEKGHQALKPSPKMKLPHERESGEKRRSRTGVLPRCQIL